MDWIAELENEFSTIQDTGGGDTLRVVHVEHTADAVIVTYEDDVTTTRTVLQLTLEVLNEEDMEAD